MKKKSLSAKKKIHNKLLTYLFGLLITAQLSAQFLDTASPLQFDGDGTLLKTGSKFSLTGKHLKEVLNGKIFFITTKINSNWSNANFKLVLSDIFDRILFQKMISNAF